MVNNGGLAWLATYDPIVPESVISPTSYSLGKLMFSGFPYVTMIIFRSEYARLVSSPTLYSSGIDKLVTVNKHLRF